jgi:hypothetical protein
MLEAFDDHMRRGSQQSNSDLLIAALVVAPFVMTMVVLLYRVGWPPNLELVLLTIVVQITATVWNAGWRAEGADAGGARPERDMATGIEERAG